MAKKSLAIFRVAFLYATFGFICLLGDFIFIAVVVSGLNKFNIVRRICRELVRISWGFFIKICILTRYLRLNFDPKISLKDSQLIVANHPSLLDVVFFLSRIKNLNCVVKAELGSNIFLMFAIKACGYISNKDNEKLLQSSLEALNSGENLLIFPEGTRTKEQILFRKAPFFIAVKAAKTITPVVINMRPKSLKKDQKWYDVPKNTIEYEIVKKSGINMGDFKLDRADPVRVRLLMQEICEIYKELK
ncbi:MAG: 1-acyl-sn-glycerol-3-phosphate acyltransferase [Campylobacter sp.]|nr:1-acyl-sn-glycerol-3-phosphate acyltransferase [Campylobacter sp.]